MHFATLVSTFTLGFAAIASAASIPSFDAYKVPIDGSVPSSDTDVSAVIFAASSLTIAVGTSPPNDGSTCPDEPKNGNFGPYPARLYTQNQIKAAFLAGAQYQASDTTVGANEYPHTFGNSPGFNFPCAGKNYMEFPIQLDNTTYDGGATTGVPDRVIWSYKESKTTLTVNYCGLIRHSKAPAGFDQCSA